MTEGEPPGDVVAHAEELIGKGCASEAVRLMRTRIESGRGGILARVVLTRALVASGELSEALAAARENAHLNPGIAQVAVALGEVLCRCGHLPTAIAEFRRALRLDPDNTDARLGLARAWLDAGEPDNAREALSRLASAPEVEALEAAAIEMKMRPRADEGYVRHLFDQFSADYDARMRGQLLYRGPEILRELASLVMPARSKLKVLDLGCGTGLAAEAFGDIAARFDGIDLSPDMIARARARGVYDLLEIADIEVFLAQPGPQYDLILAADTLVYLGDLGAVFAGARKRLAPTGMFLFTVETAEGEGFALGPKRRWRHTPSYLREAAAKAGLDVAGIVECVPRHEAGVPVAGLAVALEIA